MRFIQRLLLLCTLFLAPSIAAERDVEEVEAAIKARKFDKDLTVALMGCAVNGPGEAQGADLGISLGRGRAHLFKRGKIVGTVPEDQIVETVLQAIEEWEEEEVVIKS